jgi:hypothetical protein
MIRTPRPLLDLGMTRLRSYIVGGGRTSPSEGGPRRFAALGGEAAVAARCELRAWYRQRANVGGIAAACAWYPSCLSPTAV